MFERKVEEKKKKEEEKRRIQVWNISFVYELILVDLRLVWESCLEFLVGIHVSVRKFPTSFFVYM